MEFQARKTFTYTHSFSFSSFSSDIIVSSCECSEAQILCHSDLGRRPHPLDSSGFRRSVMAQSQPRFQSHYGSQQDPSLQSFRRPHSQHTISQNNNSDHHRIPRPHPHFQYSKCTGRKRAVCVSIVISSTYLFFSSAFYSFRLASIIQGRRASCMAA